MATQSISQGITYAETLPNFQSILNVLPDNTQKLIAPRDVRDSFFTTWENIVYKKTNITTSLVQYIGIDRDDLTQKVYFGKKRLGGKEIMTNELLTNDVDFYFYNTKTEPQDDYSTKIALLAGTGSFTKGGSLAVPYLESKVVQWYTGEYLNLEVRNKSFTIDGSESVGGDINILSDYGYVSVNGIVFPKLSETVKTENDGRYLKLVWDGLNTYYATWSVVEIPEQPDPVDPNNIFFTDDTPVPQTLGGINEGATFDNVPITEVMRQLLYPYLKPTLTAGFSVGVIESGDSVTAATQQLNYTIKRKSEFVVNGLSLVPSSLQVGSNPLIDPNTVPQGGNGISSNVKPVFNVNLPATINNSSFNVTMTITDTKGTSVPAAAGFSIVLPFYYGVSTTLTNTAAGINSILGSTSNPPTPNKLRPDLKTSASSTSPTLTTVGLPGGQGCIYFGYPSTYGDLTSIKDQNLFDVTLDFTKFTIQGIKSPNNFWGGGSENREYKFYIFTQQTGVPKLTTLSGNFKFQFNF